MCGYDGPGAWASQTDTVAEFCCHCRARTYQDRDGICQACGKDAEENEHTGGTAAGASALQNEARSHAHHRPCRNKARPQAS